MIIANNAVNKNWKSIFYGEFLWKSQYLFGIDIFFINKPRFINLGGQKNTLLIKILH